MTSDFSYAYLPRSGSHVPASPTSNSKTSHRKTSHSKRAVRNRTRTAASPEVNRRRFLASLAAATVAGVGAARLVVDPQHQTLAQATPPGPPAPGPTTPAGLLGPPAPSSRVALPGGGALMKLPGEGDLMALTVDDGASSEVVRAYTQFAKDTGMRLTFFINGMYESWTENRDLLQPMVDSGQIQLGNHTFSHPDLTTLSKDEVAQQLRHNDEFLKTTYGIGAKPYWRPPYGKHDATVDAVAADLGYTVPVLWSGSLSDSTVITEDYIVQMADQYFTPQMIVIGHLNHLPVTHVYPQLVDIIRSRNLRSVTLNDVFEKTP